jgi:phage-related protein
MKRLSFVGDSLERIREFPLGARKEAGVQLHMVQQGLEAERLEADAYSGVRSSRDSHS